VSTFYNDLYAFDLDRKRWYKLGLKQKKAKLTAEEKRAGRKLKQMSAAEGGEDGDDDDLSQASEVDDASDSDDSDNEGAALKKTGGIDAVRAEKGEFFGYIDETGNVVYIDLNEEDPEETLGATGTANAEGSAMVVADDAQMQSTAEGMQGLSVGQTVFSAVSAVQTAASGVAAMVVEDASVAAAAEERRNQETLKNQQKYKSRALKPTAGAGDDAGSTVDMAVDDGSMAGSAAAGAVGATGEPLSAIARYFAELSEPCPRINPAILIRYYKYIIL
jgi:hypothetical protein